MRKQKILARALGALIVPAIALSVPGELAHRYSFTSDVTDSVGGANGQALQRGTPEAPLGTPVVFDGSQAILDGVGGYIDLPNGIISSKTAVTIEAWVTVNAVANWARIFDFGTNTAGEVGPETDVGTGQRYMLLTSSVGTGGIARFTITDAANGAGEERPQLNDTTAFPLGVQTHVAVTYGDGQARLYVNGQLRASAPAPVPLSAVSDVNNWLGRSNWPDALLPGAYNEFRIHNNVLGALELRASALGDPDSLNYDPGTLTALTVSGEGNMSIGGVQRLNVVGTFSNIGETTLAFPDYTLTSSDPSKVTVGADGAITAAGIGSSIITATRGDRTATITITVSPAAPAEIKHRYSFSEPALSETVEDSIGGATGYTYGSPDGARVIGLGNGQATFPPAPSYQQATLIDLPDNLVSTKQNVTIETWVTWNGPANQSWQRIFDFGNSSKLNAFSPGAPTAAHGYMFLTPRHGGAAPNGPRFAARPANGAENPVLNAPGPLALGQEAHIVAVLAPQYNLSRLYINGVPVATGAAPFPLSSLTDANNWLGLAQYNDPPFNGSINEFRIWEGALTELDVALSRHAGPDAMPVAPGALQSVAFRAEPKLLIGNTAVTGAGFLGNFANVQGVDISGAGATFTSSDPNVFTVDATGGLRPLTIGSATLTANFQNRTATTTVTVEAPTALRHSLPTTLTAGNEFVNGALANTGLRADFPSATDVNVNGFTGVTHVSSDPSVLNVLANGQVQAVGPGRATITSSLGGASVISTIDVALPANFRRGALVNRYSFSEAPDSTTVDDSVGNADGTLVGMVAGSANNNFNGQGQVALAGSAWNAAPLAAFVDLPNGLVSTKSAVTIEGWANVRATTANMRYFDFGMSSQPDGAGGFQEGAVLSPGRSYMFLTPGTANPRFAIKQNTDAETPSLNSSIAAPRNVNHHFAVVYDQPNGVVRLYINGQRAGTAVATLPLSVVDDRNVWIGRSNWPDPLLNALFDEFRIYDGPLLDSDIAASFAAGPNALPATPNNAELTASISGANLVITWPATETGFRLQSKSSLTAGDWADVPDAPPTVQDGNNVVTLPLSTAGNAFYRLIK